MNVQTAEYHVTDKTSHFTDYDRDAMNALLRGELAAVETYEQAIPKFEDMTVRSALSRIRDEHAQAVEKLRRHIIDMGASPSEKSGAWGTVVTTITGAAKVLGPQTVLGTLQHGEEVGIGSYEALIADQDVPTKCKDLIHAELLPRCRAHVQTLDSVSRALETRA